MEKVSPHVGEGEEEKLAREQIKYYK